ncbi:hypothetical protein [Gardnerella vaginalis]|uniref:hypothetical protein n=1 Tax=Gardnerella vaginalis TaxID=2702 RepID=UPI001403372A|nr:hypothetical protein [Gardnerella vaginalis]
MFQKPTKTTTNAGEKTPANVPQNGNAQSRRRQTELKQSQTNLPCLRQSRRRQTELALEVPRTSNLSKLGELKKPKAIFICFRLG